MKNRYLSIGLVIATNLFAASLAYAQDTSRMDQVVQSYVDAKQSMCTVLVARDDKILFSKAYAGV